MQVRRGKKKDEEQEQKKKEESYSEIVEQSYYIYMYKLCLIFLSALQI